MTAELVTTFRRGQVPARDGSTEFDQFYAKYYPCLLGYVWKLFGAADAEDIAQETMARAFANFERLDPNRDPWPWLTVVARRLGTDVIRAHARTVVVEDQQLADLPNEDGDTPFDQVLAADDRMALKRALAQLSPNDRRVLRMREYHDLSASDMAALLECSETAVRQQLFRARRRLAERFKAVGGLCGISPVVLVRALRSKLGRATLNTTGTAGGVTAIAMSALVVAAGGTVVVGAMHQDRVVDMSADATTVYVDMFSTRPDRPVAYAVPSDVGAGRTDGNAAPAKQPPTAGQPKPVDIDVDNEVSDKPWTPGDRRVTQISVVVLGHHVITIKNEHYNPEDYKVLCDTPVTVCE